MRFTLDSNILVRAVTSPRGPALDPRIQARYRIAPEEAACFAGTLADASHLVEPVVVRPIVLSDPDDDPVLYTAVDGKADVLCTRNIRHFAAPDIQSFCAEQGLRVMTDVDVLHDLLGSQSRGHQ